MAGEPPSVEDKHEAQEVAGVMDDEAQRSPCREGGPVSRLGGLDREEVEEVALARVELRDIRLSEGHVEGGAQGGGRRRAGGCCSFCPSLSLATPRSAAPRSSVVLAKDITQ